MKATEKLGSVIEEHKEQFLAGELQIKKADLWLILAAGTLTGLAIGLLIAPLTHGLSIAIGSNNGNNSGNGSTVGIGNGNGGGEEGERSACGKHDKKSAKARRRGRRK